MHLIGRQVTFGPLLSLAFRHVMQLIGPSGYNRSSEPLAFRYIKQLIGPSGYKRSSVSLAVRHVMQLHVIGPSDYNLAVSTPCF